MLYDTNELYGIGTMRKVGDDMTIQSYKSEAVRQNWRDKLDDVFRGATIVIERYTKPIAVLIGYEEYERLKELENKVLWAESKRIADKNDRDGTWVDGSVVEERMRHLRALED